ncbi:hypothetical protein PM028_01665 [Clostridium paraputrificum]|nr:hypothetical protein [Clostridium paraputrificum]
MLKKRVNEIFSYVKKKNAYKIYSYKEFKEADINFGEKIGDLNFCLPNYLYDDLKEKCIDEAFNLAKEFILNIKIVSKL